MERVLFLLLLVLQTNAIHSFLLNNSSPTGLTSFEFQHLLQMILNEEHSRNHVEDEVTSIEQRVAEIENDLKTKYQQDIADVKTAMELQVNATKVKLEHEMNTTQMVVERQTYALEKEKSNRYQLEREYTRLMMDFKNLSLAYNDLLITTGNQTRTLGAKYETLRAGIKVMNESSVLLEANVSAIQTDMTVHGASIASNLAMISDLTTRTNSINTTAEQLKKKLGMYINLNT